MAKTKTYQKNCRICNKKIEVISEVIGRLGSGIDKKGLWCHSSSYCSSKDGVFFEDGGVWFCNVCWHELMKKTKIKKILSDIKCNRNV